MTIIKFSGLDQVLLDAISMRDLMLYMEFIVKKCQNEQFNLVFVDAATHTDLIHRCSNMQRGLRHTFLPETALRRAPSSLSFPKNWSDRLQISKTYLYPILKIMSYYTFNFKVEGQSKYLWKLHRTTILLLLLLYMAQIGRMKPSQKNQARQKRAMPSCHRHQLQFRRAIHKRWKVL